MQRESQKDRTILCKYEPTEPGDYRIEVKWSGENVPGSPFMVMIFDTQEELSRFLQVDTKHIIHKCFSFTVKLSKVKLLHLYNIFDNKLTSYCFREGIRRLVTSVKCTEALETILRITDK